MISRNLLGVAGVVLAVAILVQAGSARAAAITATWDPGVTGDWNDGGNWSFSTPPATATFPNNDVNDTFNVLIDDGAVGNAVVNLNVNVTVDTVAVSGGDSLNFNNSNDLTIAGGSLINDGAINLNSSGSTTDLTFSGNATISGTGSITLGDNLNNRILTTVGTDVLTNAAGHIIQGAGTLLQNSGGLINQGTITQQGTVGLTIDPGGADAGGGFNVVNSGTLRAEGTGGLLLNAATYQNTGASIEAGNGSFVSFLSPGVEITGGEFSTTGTGEIRANTNVGAILDGVTVTAGTNLIQASAADLRIRNGITNDGNWELNSTGGVTDVTFIGTQTLSGSGEIVMTDNINNRIFTGSGTDVLTIGANQTVRGAGQLLTNSGGVHNDGTILQQGTQTLTIDPGAADAGGGFNFVNDGTFRADGSGGLILNAGTFDNNTTIEAADGSFVRFNSSGVEIHGGNLTSSGSGEFQAFTNVGAILDGVTVTAGTNLIQASAADLRIRNGITNDGNWELNSSGGLTDINFIGSQTIAGSGEIVMTDSITNRLFVSNGADVITLGANQTLRGAGQVLVNAGGFINDGTLLQQGGQALILDPGAADAGGGANFINNSVLRTEGPGGLHLNAGVYDNNTTIEAQDGSHIRFLSSGVEILGGNLTTSGSAEIQAFVATGAILDGVTITGGSNLVQATGADLRIRNGITNDGNWELNSSGALTDINFIGSQTIAGSGEIVMTDNTGNRLFVSNGADVVTLGANQTLRGAGQVLINAGGFINDGTLLQQGGQALILDPGAADAGGGANFINNSVLRTEGPGGLHLNAGVYDNNTTIEAQDGSHIRFLASGVEILGGNLTTSGSAEIQAFVGTGAILDGVTITGGSNLVQANVADLRIRNGITNDGNWELNSSGALTDITFIGSQTIAGSGEIVMTDQSSNRLVASGGADVITLGANQTVRGSGRLLLGSGGMVNLGTILAEGAVNEIEIDAGLTGFSNQGLLRASGAAGLDIDGNNFSQDAGLVDIDTGSRIDITVGDYNQTGGQTLLDGIMDLFAFNADIEMLGGVFGGTGNITFSGGGAHVFNNVGGVLAAGDSPGILTLDGGDYVQGNSGAFEFELFGASVGIGHDLLNIFNGNADLAGNLNVVADQTFASTLNIGDQFEVIRLDGAGVFLGSGFLDQIFDSITVNLAGLAFNQLFVGNSLFIEVTEASVEPPGEVPEPGAILILLTGLSVMLLARRQRATARA